MEVLMKSLHDLFYRDVYFEETWICLYPKRTTRKKLDVEHTDISPMTDCDRDMFKIPTTVVYALSGCLGLE